MTEFTKTGRNRVKRIPERGHYDRETIYHILDEALICHVGFVEKGQPFVIPINFARVDDAIFLHDLAPTRHRGTGKIDALAEKNVGDAAVAAELAQNPIIRRIEWCRVGIRQKNLRCR